MKKKAAVNIPSIMIALLLGSLIMVLGFSFMSSFFEGNGVTYSDSVLDSKIDTFSDNAEEIAEDFGVSLEQPGETNEIATDSAFAKGLKAVIASLKASGLMITGVAIMTSIFAPFGIPTIVWGTLLAISVVLLTVLVASAFWRYKVNER